MANTTTLHLTNRQLEILLESLALLNKTVMEEIDKNHSQGYKPHAYELSEYWATFAPAEISEVIQKVQRLYPF